MIRRMTEADLPAVLELENKLFPASPWPERQFLYELNGNPYAAIYLIEQDSVIAGYVDLWIMFEQAEIADIGVAAEYQNKGLGSRLMKYVINEAIKAGCENLTLEVRVSNAPAIALYEKYGFINVAVRKHYYENGENANLMLKPLGGLEYDDDIGD